MKWFPEWQISLFCIGFTLILISCSNPAIMILDPASESYYEMQGSDHGRFIAAANKAGFQLSILSLNKDKPFTEQIDGVWRSSGGKVRVLIYPPLLSQEAIAGGKRFTTARTVLLSGDPIVDTDGLVSLEIHKEQAFQKLGIYIAKHSAMNSNEKISVFFLADSEIKRNNLEVMRSAFLKNGGSIDRLLVHSWDRVLGAEDMRQASLQLGNSNLALIFLDIQSQEFFTYLGAWQGKFIGEQLGAIASGLPRLIGSIDVSWNDALLTVLQSLKDIEIKNGRKVIGIDADFHIYNEKPENKPTTSPQ